MISFIIGFLVAGTTIFFAFQNNEMVVVKFFGNELDGSLALIIISSMLIGVLIGVIIFIPRAISADWQTRKLQKENLQLKKRLGDEPMKFEAPGLGEEGDKNIEIVE